MLVITNTYTTEDGETFQSKNQALIHAAIRESDLFFEEYKLKMIVTELDKRLIVIDRSKLETVEEALDFPTLQDTEIKE